MDIYHYSILDNLRMPVFASFMLGDNIIIYDLYRPASRRNLATVKKDLAKAKHIFKWADENNHRLITTNYKDLIVAYDLPIDNNSREIYDLNLDRNNTIKHTDNDSKDKLLLNKILSRMKGSVLKPYHKLLADASVVYQDLENKGVLINGRLCQPKWSVKTFSGRSATSLFNLQGYTSNEHIGTISSNESYVLLHFDWMAADIRVASLLSGDNILQESFNTSDPYTYMLDRKLFGTRDQCKIFLLKSINSLNISTELYSVYPKLCKWLEQCSYVTRMSEGYLETLLGKKFKIESAKNGLAVLNGAMQGSIAHAMHNVLRKIWDIYPTFLCAEIHDSIVMSVPRDPNIIKSVIADVSSIMTKPFDGYLDYNPFFPVRVSIGYKWKQWNLIKIFRESGVVNVKQKG